MNIIKCPNCGDDIIIEKVKCGIFRHGVYKSTMKQIGPHTKDDYVNKLIKNDKIYGCGYQFNYKDVQLIK